VLEEMSAPELALVIVITVNRVYSRIRAARCSVAPLVAAREGGAR
jgi:hypothetical protein